MNDTSVDESLPTTQRPWIIARANVLRPLLTRNPELLAAFGRASSWKDVEALAAASHGYIDASHLQEQLALPAHGAYGAEIEAIRGRSCIVVLAPTHALVTHEASFDGRPSIGVADYRLVDARWKSGTQGLKSPTILDAPDAVHVEFGADDGLDPQDAAVGYWSGVLLAGGRANGPAEAIAAAHALLLKFGLVYSRGFGIVDEFNAMLGLGTSTRDGSN